jgi:hypothetical protein
MEEPGIAGRRNQSNTVETISAIAKDEENSGFSGFFHNFAGPENNP